MDTELKLPLLGDVMTEGTLAEWLRPDGAEVAKGEPLYQLETDKVSYTVEAPAAGRLVHLVAAGETIDVGTVVGRIAVGLGMWGATCRSPRQRGGWRRSSGLTWRRCRVEGGCVKRMFRRLPRS